MKNYMLTYKEPRSNGFLTAFNKLVNYSGLATPTALKIARAKKAMDAEMLIAQEFFTKMIKEHAELDESGNIKPVDEASPDTFKIREEMKTKWFEAMEAFEKEEFAIPTGQIDYADLSGAKLSAADLIALEPLLTDNSVVSEATPS